MADQTGTILLVDDEEIVIGVGKQMLEKLGFSVLTATSGEEALEIYKANKEIIGLVILDMIMPGMAAGDIYNGLRALEPEVKVLLSSGYGVDEQTNAVMNLGCKGFIQKPFNLQVFASKIEEILHQA